MSQVFITKTASYLPNEPVLNDDIEHHLGKISGKPSRVRSIVLRQNGIKNRFYAIDTEQNITHTNAELAAVSVKKILDSDSEAGDVEMLLCATSNADQLIPSHASMVHGQLKNKPLELYSFSGVCLTSLQALKTGYLAVKADEASKVICSTSELASAGLLSKNFEVEYEYTTRVGADPYMAFEKDFLRFMLSDGSAAVLLENKPTGDGVTLQIDWVDMDSYANELPTCMFYGAELKDDGELKGWKEFTQEELLNRSVLTLKQDIKTLKLHIIDYWIKHIKNVLKKHSCIPSEIKYVIPHVSSMFFYDKLNEAMKENNLDIAENKWFTNLTSVGNVGSASIFIALDELIKSDKLRSGDKILLLVPESGRFSYGTAQLTVT